MDFVVAIPSYKRADVLVSHTLSLCNKCNLPREIIHVFIVDDALEVAAYQNAIVGNGGGLNIHTGPVGLHNMRNFITDFFPEGQKILHMDDDVKDIVFMEMDGSVEPVTSSKRYPLYSMANDTFISWIETAFNTLSLGNAAMFGIYPVRNGYFMKDLPYVTTDLRFCVGTCWGCVNDKTIRITLEEKEDYERTLLYYERYGAIHRYNHIAPVTTYYKTKGGMQSRPYDRRETSRASCEYLVLKFPLLCKLHKIKASGIHEIRLKTK